MLPVLVLSESEVRQHLDPAQLLTALESAFRDRYSDVLIPARVHMDLADSIFLIMPCHDRSGGALGMKLVTVQHSPARPQDRVQATFMLLDLTTGCPRLVMSANYLTDLRTAATSALATKFLAREDAKTLGIFGTGRQARAHLQVLPRVRGFERAMVCGRDSRRARLFAEQMSAEIGLPVTPVDAADCAANSDVLCTCTTSRSPLFDGRLLRPGTHLNLVGAFQLEAREVDSATVVQATVVVDTYDGALTEAGDLVIPMREGSIQRDHIKMDLRELAQGNKLRRSPREITLFKSVGCALEDLVAAELVEKSLTATKGVSR